MPCFMCCHHSAGGAARVHDDVDPLSEYEGVYGNICEEVESIFTANPTLLTSKPIAKPGDVHIPKPEQLVADAKRDSTPSAAEGRRCMQLSEATGSKTEAEYFVDADLGRFVVKTAGEAGMPGTVEFPISSIEEIYTVNDGEDCFPSHLVQLLTPSEKAGLFLIVRATDALDAESSGLYLVEASDTARDDLLRTLLQLGMADR